MKIIHIAPNSPYHGGAETVAGQLCEQLAQRKHNITWYSLNGAFYNGADKMFGKGFSIKEFKPLLGAPFYIPPREFVRKLKQERADVIHIHNVHTLLPLLVLLFKNNFSIKIVLQPHYHIRGQNFVRNKFFFIYKTLLNLLILNFSAVVVNSKFEQISFVKDFPKISPKLILVPEEYSIEIPDSMTWRPTEKPKKILYVGTLKKYKNVDKLIQAFKILTSKYAGLELIIVGKGTQKEELEALELNLAVADDIVWKNDLDYTDMLNEYAEASVVYTTMTHWGFSPKKVWQKVLNVLILRKLPQLWKILL
jgi:glycosyltransferase involved in cell wall biosynthesis